MTSFNNVIIIIIITIGSGCASIRNGNDIIVSDRHLQTHDVTHELLATEHLTKQTGDVA